MRDRDWCVGLVVFMTVLLPAWAVGDKKTDANKKDRAAAAAAKERKKALEKILSSTRINGRLIRVEGAQRFLAVQVKVPIAVPNLGAAQNSINLQRQLAD